MEADSRRAFTIRAWVDRSSYRIGDAVRLSAELCSQSDSELLMETGGTPRPRIGWRIIDRTGHAVADSSHVGYRRSLIQLRFAPYGRVQWQSPEKWDLRYWNRQTECDRGDIAGVPVRGRHVPPGQYRLEVQWHASAWNASPEVPPVIHAASSDVFVIENLHSHSSESNPVG